MLTSTKKCLSSLRMDWKTRFIVQVTVLDVWSRNVENRSRDFVLVLICSYSSSTVAKTPHTTAGTEGVPD